MRHNNDLSALKIILRAVFILILMPTPCTATHTLQKIYTRILKSSLTWPNQTPHKTTLVHTDTHSLQNKKNSPYTRTHTFHKDYPLNDDTPLTLENIAPENQEETITPSLLTLEPMPTLTPEQTLTNTANHEALAVTEQVTCTNSKIRALVAGCCLGSVMGALQFKTRRFFPKNWIVGFFIRILLVEAIATPCTAPNKDLMRESAWASDWLVYGYLWLHSWYLI